MLSGPGLIGVAFDPHGGIVVCSNDTAYRLARLADRSLGFAESGGRALNRFASIPYRK